MHKKNNNNKMSSDMRSVTGRNKSRAIAGRTARCRCKFRHVRNFTTASCAFSARSWLSCI